MSKGEDKMAVLLRQEYPHIKIREQVTLKYGDMNLYVDFLIPVLKLAFEIDGRQHKTYVPYFHKRRSMFLRQKENDGYKQEILEKLGCKLIRFKEDEISLENLRARIKEINA